MTTSLQPREDIADIADNVENVDNVIITYTGTEPSNVPDDPREKNLDDVLARVISCFGLLCPDDNRVFSMTDMEKINTSGRMSEIINDLKPFYPPCKARVYLNHFPSERRCVTILRQMLRRKHKTLLSREKNIRGKKITYYQIIDTKDVDKLKNMTKKKKDDVWVSF